MKVKQLRPEYVQVWSVWRCLLLGEKKSQKFFIIVISICFSYSKCLVIELEADENHSHFWMRQALPWPSWRRGWEPPPPPLPLNVILRGPHSKISAMGPSAIMVSGPSTVYHLVFTPILPFPCCNPTEEFFFTWRWKDHNRLLTNKSLFSRP